MNKLYNANGILKFKDYIHTIGRSSAIADRLRTLVGKKKTWKLQKWLTTFHTHTKRILKLPNRKDLFFLIYYSTPLRRYTRNVYSPHSCMNVELEWIAHSWKQFLFFLHETLRNYSLWNVRINFSDGLRKLSLSSLGQR